MTYYSFHSGNATGLKLCSRQCTELCGHSHVVSSAVTCKPFGKRTVSFSFGEETVLTRVCSIISPKLTNRAI